MGSSSELLLVAAAVMVAVSSLFGLITSAADQNLERNSSNVTISSSQNQIGKADGFRRVACGSSATNLTHVAVKNPQYPEAIYTKAICEAIIERVDPSIHELNIKFKQLELYRPTFDGQCLHDRFAIYTDLNAIVGPVLCGNQTGRSISIPFVKQHSNLIVSVMTSDLDHDRTWHIEIEQRRR